MYDLKQFLQSSAENQEQQMYEWLSSLANASEEERQQGFRQLLLETAKLDVPDKTHMIKVRIIALTKLPMDQIKKIARSRFQAMKDFGEVNEADRELSITVMEQMPIDVQRTVVQIISELRSEFTAMSG